jgi:hypothetical protein
MVRNAQKLAESGRLDVENEYHGVERADDADAVDAAAVPGITRQSVTMSP